MALGLLATAFVAPRPAAPPRGDAMALRVRLAKQTTSRLKLKFDASAVQAGGEYTGFVPDLQRPGFSFPYRSSFLNGGFS